MMHGKLTMGPILFHWSAAQKRDFYYRVADEAPVDTVYMGEVICSKRTPFFEKDYHDIAERLARAGKTVVFSSLAEVMIPRERKLTESLCAMDGYEIEANDASALFHLRGKQHRIGQYFNVYNEETMACLATRGANHIALPSELPKSSLAALGGKAASNKIGLEVQVYGRVGLALSARCYHARAHDCIKDNCQFVCENDPDGMTLQTLSKQDFLCINGVQTLSYKYINLIREMKQMTEMGIGYFRISPHTGDMVVVAKLFDDVLNGTKEASEALDLLARNDNGMPYSNGFYHGKEGHSWN